MVSSTPNSKGHIFVNLRVYEGTLDFAEKSEGTSYSMGTLFFALYLKGPVDEYREIYLLP